MMNDVIIIPQDFMQALMANNTARLAFEALPTQHKRDVIAWLQGEKQATSREKRVAQAVERLLNA